MMKKVGKLYMVKCPFNVDNFNEQRTADTYHFFSGHLYMLTRLPDTTRSSTFSNWVFLNGKTEVSVSLEDFDYYFEEYKCR